jgi:catechol 2,3-dioxygenase-like lactoylglutathione lyase family enzyme
MFIGAHVLLYTEDPATDRAFFRDVLGFPFVDVGHGWLIFKLPPGEAAFHPTDRESPTQTNGGRHLPGAMLYLMCDDLKAQMAQLEAKGVRFTKPEEAAWGIKTTIKLPGGSEVGLYQPRHATAFNL